MKIILSAPASYDLGPIAGILKPYSFQCQAIPLQKEEIRNRQFATAPITVLIFPEQNYLVLGEHISEIREAIGKNNMLLVCAPQASDSEYRDLLECGADKIVSPGNWHSPTVADRILSELILNEKVPIRSFGEMWGATIPMQKLYEEIEVAAPYAEPVLILGETGSGKELVAKEIHRLSGRPDLLPLNCAALTSDLLESELFGHERGAFTGSTGPRTGLLRAARNGTVFLDEIGELSKSAQAKLLRVIEEKKVRPVGSNQWHPINMRLILATNRNLEEDCESGLFRSDLYQRICLFTIKIPPLKMRKADIPLLVSHFVGQFNSENKKKCFVPSKGLDPLFRYDWPGNVRELRRVVYNAAAFADKNGCLSVRQILKAVANRGPASLDQIFRFEPTIEKWPEVQARIRNIYFRKILEAAQGNKLEAAKLAGISRSQIYEIFKQIDTENET